MNVQTNDTVEQAPKVTAEQIRTLDPNGRVFESDEGDALFVHDIAPPTQYDVDEFGYVVDEDGEYILSTLGEKLTEDQFQKYQVFLQDEVEGKLVDGDFASTDEYK